MAITVRGKMDAQLRRIAGALKSYQADHPSADIVLYRYYPACVRVRIIDPDFQRVSRSDRHDRVWTYLERLPESVLNELSILLLLTPREVSRSFANIEFEDPVPSGV